MSAVWRSAAARYSPAAPEMPGFISVMTRTGWQQNNKPPTGQTDTCLLLAPDFANQHKVYGVTRGVESVSRIPATAA